LHNPNTNNNQIITSKYPPKDNAESLFVLNYSNQMETLPFVAEDSEMIRRSSTLRVRKTAPMSNKKKDDWKNKNRNNIIEPLMDHHLLSKEEEYALVTKIKKMTQIRNQISEIVEAVSTNNNSPYRNSDILVEECSRLYGIEGETQLALITDKDIKYQLQLKGSRKELNQLLEDGSRRNHTFPLIGN
jgi:hypothetical protein